MLIVASAIIKLLLITLVGVYLYRRQLVEERVLNFLTFFVINLTIPCLIFSHLVEQASSAARYSLLAFMGLSAALFLCGCILGVIFSWGRRPQFRRELISLVSFQNCGYLPINIALFLFPAYLRERFLVYVFLYLLGFNIIMWSVGSFFIFKKKNEVFRLKSIFTPPITSTIIALILIYTHNTRFIPSLIMAPLRMIGDTSFVLSAVILGCWLGRVDLASLSRRLWVMLEISLLKLIIVPLIFLMLVVRFETFSLLGLFIVMEAAMPSAASLPLIANLRGADSEFVSQAVFFTHLLSIFTIPLWLGIFLNISGFSF